MGAETAMNIPFMNEGAKWFLEKNKAAEITPNK